MVTRGPEFFFSLFCDSINKTTKTVYIRHGLRGSFHLETFPHKSLTVNNYTGVSGNTPAFGGRKEIDVNPRSRLNLRGFFCGWKIHSLLHADRTDRGTTAEIF